MTKAFALATLLGLFGSAAAAIYPATDIPKSIGSAGPNTVTSFISIPSSASAISDVNLTLQISHTWNADLDITLVHPDGTRIELSSDNGGSSDNYTNTTFDQQAGSSITQGTAPYSGSYRPEGNLDTLNGKGVAGNWQLEVHDDGNGDGGTLHSWSLDITAIATDNDGDGLDDSWEIANGLDPNDDGSLNINNGPDGDPDNDGLPNSEEYQQGHDPQSNDFGRAYEARPTKATLMVVSAHPDDEGIFFGGVVPYYTQTLDLPTIFVSMTSGDATLAPEVREAEMRNAAWEYGLRNQPLFPRFRDYWFGTDADNVSGSWDIWNDNVIGNGDEAAGKLKATQYLATQIRKFRPEVVVGHDFEGEYGHSNHKAAAIATADAFAMAADPGIDLEGLPAWQSKKLYIHSYDRDASAVSKLFHDHWETPSIGGLTPREVANNALTYHVTQGAHYVSTAHLTGEVTAIFDAHPSEHWGLHTSFVGPDSVASDFTINGTLYAGYAKQDFLENISIDRDGDLLPDAWENLHGASSTAMVAGADDDQDGLSNYEEFQLGLDPTRVSKAHQIHMNVGATNLSFTLPRASGTGYTGVTRSYVLESSSDMKNWIPEAQGVALGQTVNFPMTPDSESKFYRCRITVE